MNRKPLALPLFVGLLLACLPCLVEAQVPLTSKVSKELITRFKADAEPVRIVFHSYQLQQSGIGFVIVSRRGDVLGKDELPDGNSEDAATGVYDTTGDGTPDIVLAAGVGAKSHEVKVYSFSDNHSKEIFNWSGWQFEVVRLGAQPVIAVTPTDYGTLPKLYRWKQGQFVESNEDFPEFFDKAIKLQQDNIERGGFPAYVYAQACDLGATALVYGKKYSQARDLCERALTVVESSPDVIPNSTRPSPGELEVERQQAAGQIQRTLNALPAAERQGSSKLKQQ